MRQFVKFVDTLYLYLHNIYICIYYTYVYNVYVFKWLQILMWIHQMNVGMYVHNPYCTNISIYISWDEFSTCMRAYTYKLSRNLLLNIAKYVVVAIDY